MGSPGSRAWRFRTCHGSRTARGPPATRDSATGDVAFRPSDSVDTPVSLISRLNSPACTCPCERFAAPLRVANASLGVIVGRWPFNVELFHLLLHTGLSRHFPDVLVIDRHFDKYRRGGRKLIDLCGHYGVGENLHEAQNDVEASVAVLLRQVSKYPELRSMGPDALYAAQQGWHRDWAENFSQYLVSKGKDALSVSEVAWPLETGAT